MNPAQLLEHFDRISEAPDAVARLRRFILDLAVRGKLVEQDPNNEPAAELLKRIQAEGSKKAMQPSPVAPGELPFALPHGWSWTRFGEVFSLEYGDNLPAEKRSNTGEYPVYGSNGVVGSHFECYVNSPCIVVGRKGSAGALNLSLSDGCCVTDVAYYCIPPSGLDMAFSFKLFHTLGLDSLGKGVKPGLSRNEAYVLPIAIPPLAEQHRIVAKVDELMALCDQLELAKNEREARRDRLVKASLHRIGTAPAAGETATVTQSATRLRGAARFHLDHLPRLTTRPEHIKQLRQTILNLAVRGRLVPQDPSDEPAGELLARKVCLPSGYKRRRKILKEISVDAPVSLFPAIPLTWKYADIQSLYDLNVIIDYADGNHGALYPRSNEFGDDGVTFVTAKDLVDGRVIWKSCAKLNEERANQLPKGWAQGGDVLLTHNATVGRVARIEANVGRFLLGTSVTFYRLNRTVLESDFFYYLLKSSMWQGQLEAIMAQTTRNQVSIQKQAFFRVVVPPLAEQHRIVAKVDELMALCDQLEAQLTITQTNRRRLLEAVLRDALAPALEKAA